MTTTTRKDQALGVGDWIVHQQHGIGQIAGRTVNDISGEETVYFTLKTRNSVVWIPAERLSEDNIRPLATPEEMQEVIDILMRPAREMDESTRKRKSRIYQVETDNSPTEIARLVRDLRERRRSEGKLYAAERRALRSLTKQLVNEWAAAFDVRPEIAKKDVAALLQPRPREPEDATSANTESMRQKLIRQLGARERAVGD
jgi:RNA polymerase-interacting CarD/CdnL/TRCF family regulator